MLHKSIILKTVLIFLAAYIISLLFWIQINDTYSYFITTTASKLVAELKNVKVEEIRQGKDIFYVTFCRSLRNDDMLIDLSFKTSAYTFNVPLTFSIMASLCLFINRRRRAYAEAAFLLFIVHFIWVFSLEAQHLTGIFMGKGIETASKTKLFLYQFLWGFSDNMLVRCEPFLIGFYMYIRFRR